MMTQLKTITLAGLACLAPCLVNSSENIHQQAQAIIEANQISDPIEQQQILIELQAEDDGAGVIPPQ